MISQVKDSRVKVDRLVAVVLDLIFQDCSEIEMNRIE